MAATHVADAAPLPLALRARQFTRTNTNMLLGDAKCVADELKTAVLEKLGPQCIKP